MHICDFSIHILHALFYYFPFKIDLFFSLRLLLIIVFNIFFCKGVFFHVFSI